MDGIQKQNQLFQLGNNCPEILSRIVQKNSSVSALSILHLIMPSSSSMKIVLQSWHSLLLSISPNYLITCTLSGKEPVTISRSSCMCCDWSIQQELIPYTAHSIPKFVWIEIFFYQPPFSSSHLWPMHFTLDPQMQAKKLST